MTLQEIANTRLQSQQLAKTALKKLQDIVAYMGAIQAQDYPMAKWAIGARLPNSTDKQIEEAVNRGQIIRTHIMRPTWHLVSADDIWWMLELVSPHMLSSLKSRQKELELDEKVFSKTHTIIGKVLNGHKHLTRDEIMAELKKAKIALDPSRAIHIMYKAEADGIVCNGIMKGKNHTYALLEERVKKPKGLTREEALAKLALRYFTSHGPATVQDFIWWSGLPAKDGRNALDMIKSKLVSESNGTETYWLSNSIKIQKNNSSVHLLPAFDEFIISYKNREASIKLLHQKKAFTSNGIFKPIIVVNGQVTGIWKRSIKKDKVIIEPAFFDAKNKIPKSVIEKEASKFGKFLDKKVEIKN
jgi:hypothetical protein